MEAALTVAVGSNLARYILAAVRPPGRIYVGSCRRGQVHSRRAGCVTYNVTSSSRYAPSLALSPMYLQTDAGHPFENEWQYRKVYEGLGHAIIHSDGTVELTEEYWAWRKRGLTLRDPKGKGIRTPAEVKRLKKQIAAWRPLGALTDEGELLGYVESRWEIYFPLYQELIYDLPVVEEMAALVRSGQDIMILDVDGPPSDRYPQGIHFTEVTFRTALEDVTYPCGHGWGVCNVVQQRV